MKFVPRPSGPPRPNILLYGGPKMGKTAAACSMPDGVLLLNCDTPNATRFARSKKRDPEGHVLELEIPPYKKGESRLLDLIFEVTRAVSDPQQDLCRTVIVDPLNDLYRRLLDEQSYKALKPTFDHRMAVANYIERFCRHLCELPYISAIFVAHELAADRGEEGLEFFPNTGSKTGSQTGLGPKIMGMVDIIGYTGTTENEDTGEIQYMAQLVPGKGRRGGDRFDCLGKYRPLDLAEWMRVITEADAEMQRVSTSTQRPTPAEPDEQTGSTTEDPPPSGNSENGSSEASESPAPTPASSGAGRGRKKAT